MYFSSRPIRSAIISSYSSILESSPEELPGSNEFLHKMKTRLIKSNKNLLLTDWKKEVLPLSDQSTSSHSHHLKKSLNHQPKEDHIKEEDQKKKKEDLSFHICYYTFWEHHINWYHFSHTSFTFTSYKQEKWMIGSGCMKRCDIRLLSSLLVVVVVVCGGNRLLVLIGTTALGSVVNNCQYLIVNNLMITFERWI